MVSVAKWFLKGFWVFFSGFLRLSTNIYNGSILGPVLGFLTRLGEMTSNKWKLRFEYNIKGSYPNYCILMRYNYVPLRTTKGALLKQRATEGTKQWLWSNKLNIEYYIWPEKPLKIQSVLHWHSNLPMVHCMLTLFYSRSESF